MSLSKLPIIPFIPFQPFLPNLQVVGGTNGFLYSIDVHKFCLKTHRWTEMYRKRVPGVYPEERYRHEVILFKNQLFIFGGGTSSECFGFERIPVFELSTGSWRPQETNGSSGNVAEFPVARRCHGCVQMSNYAFIFGGTNGVSIFDDVWRLDFDSFTWTRLDVTLPIPVFFHGATLSDSGRLTIFGGVKEINPDPEVKTRTNDMFEAWLTIPSLQQISWMAFLSYCHLDDLTTCSVDGMRKLGIPRSFTSLIQESISDPAPIIPPTSRTSYLTIELDWVSINLFGQIKTTFFVHFNFISFIPDSRLSLSEKIMQFTSFSLRSFVSFLNTIWFDFSIHISHWLRLVVNRSR